MRHMSTQLVVYGNIHTFLNLTDKKSSKILLPPFPKNRNFGNDMSFNSKLVK